MDNGKISVRYARALLASSLEQHCEREVYDGLVRLTDQYSLAINAFNEALSNPMVTDEEKLTLIKTAIGEPLHPWLDRFIHYVVEKKRENKIHLIALKYQEMYRKEKHLLRANVTTAAELNERTLEKIKEYVERTFNCGAEMHVKVDPSLIGGFILDIEHQRLDESIAGQLRNIEFRIKNLESK